MNIKTQEYLNNIIDHFYDNDLNEYLDEEFNNTENIEFLFEACNKIIFLDDTLNESLLVDSNELFILQEGLRDFFRDTKQRMDENKYLKKSKKYNDKWAKKYLKNHAIISKGNDYNVIAKDNKKNFLKQYKDRTKMANQNYKENSRNIKANAKLDKDNLNFEKRQLKSERRKLRFEKMTNMPWSKNHNLKKLNMNNRINEINNTIKTDYNKKAYNSKYGELNRATSEKHAQNLDIYNQNNRNSNNQLFNDVINQNNMTNDQAKTIIQNQFRNTSQTQINPENSKNIKNLELNKGQSAEDMKKQSEINNPSLAQQKEVTPESSTSEQSKTTNENFSFENDLTVKDKFALYEILDINGIIPNKLNSFLLIENLLLENVYLMELDNTLTESTDNFISNILKNNGYIDDLENIELFEQLINNNQILFY